MISGSRGYPTIKKPPCWFAYPLPSATLEGHQDHHPKRKEGRSEPDHIGTRSKDGKESELRQNGSLWNTTRKARGEKAIAYGIPPGRRK